MWRYVVKRLILGAVTIAIVTAIVFFLLQALPGHWYDALVNRPNQSPAQRKALLHYYGADLPVPLQFFNFIRNLFQWPPDLGFSYYQSQDVSTAIASRVPNTVMLMGVSYIISLLIALPVGIISAVRQYSKLDNAVTAFSFIGYSMPNFWFGAILIFVFALPHGGHDAFLPLGGFSSNSTETNAFQTLLNNPVDLARHLAMPVLVLVVQQVAGYARYVRSTMLEVLRQDYIRTARAKGLSAWRIVVRHGFRNSLLPLITLFGLDIPQLFVGAVITENLFGWRGMGQLFVQSAYAHDTTILVGVLLILSVLVVVGNLVADLLYTVADPRISYSGAR